jgi:hypothetical protein
LERNNPAVAYASLIIAIYYFIDNFVIVIGIVFLFFYELVFEPRPIAMFLSLSIGCHYKPYYETHEFLLSSV